MSVIVYRWRGPKRELKTPVFIGREEEESELEGDWEVSTKTGKGARTVYSRS